MWIFVLKNEVYEIVLSELLKISMFQIALLVDGSIIIYWTALMCTEYKLHVFLE